MINLEEKLAEEFLVECCERLCSVAEDLHALEKSGSEIDEQLANRVVRSLHSISGASFFELWKIRDLAHRMEDVLALIRARKVAATPEAYRILLRATEMLRELIQSPDTSNQADIAKVMSALARLYASVPPSAEKYRAYAVDQECKDCMDLRVLLVEDDSASRLLLQTFLSRYGECHIAVNGREAVDVFRSALEQGQRYDLICMDIMMPEMDGLEAVRQVRAMEEARSIFSPSGSKIIMTTAVDDLREIIKCFQEFCDGYLMKPIILHNLLRKMKAFHLVQ